MDYENDNWIELAQVLSNIVLKLRISWEVGKKIPVQQNIQYL